MKKTKYTLRKDGRIVMTKTIEGKRVCFYGQTDKEAEQKYADYLKAKPQKSKSKVRTFDKVAEGWWEQKEPELSPGSVRVYRARYNEIRAEFMDIPVTDITPLEIIGYLRKLSARDYSQKVINSKKSIIKGILDHALINGDIQNNPCINLPTIKGKPKQPRLAASDDDLKRVEAHRNDSDIARMVYFILWTGCRRGEAAALQWKHLNRDSHTAHICQTLTYSSPTPKIKPSPKTAAGVRDVFIPQKVLDALPSGDKNPNGYIFFPKGLPKEHQFQDLIDDYRAAVGLTCTLHQLRHSYATMLHTAGVDPKDAQYLLGHSTITLTQDIYTEVNKAAQTKTQKQIEKFMNKL